MVQKSQIDVGSELAEQDERPSRSNTDKKEAQILFMIMSFSGLVKTIDAYKSNSFRTEDWMAGSALS